MAKQTLIVFLLDRTGSMGGKEEEVEEAYRKYIETLQHSDISDAIRFTLALFDSKSYDKLCEAVPITEAPSLKFEPRAATPLFDSLGQTIQEADAIVTSGRGYGGAKRQRVNIVVLTDGLENDSKEFTRDDIFRMIREKEERQGWAFTYLAADLDVWEQGQTLGIHYSNALDFHHNYASGIACAANSNILYVQTDGVQQRNLVHAKGETNG